MITADPDQAAAAVAGGEPVVLIVAPGTPEVGARPGRLALLVGEPGDPEVRKAAEAMEAELFPPRPER